MRRDTRRRLALYGSAGIVALVLLAVPRLVSMRAPKVKVRSATFDLPAASANEATETLKELVRVDTSNPPGITKGAIDVIARVFACEGIPYQIVGANRDSPILVARLAGRAKAGALLLLNHVDVEPPGDLKLWAVPPFAAQMGLGTEEFYLYGRGTLDMKSQAVAGIYAMAALKRAGVVPSHDIVYMAESGEETYTPELGIGWVLDHRPDLLAGVTDVFNEGGVNETVSGDINRFGIEVMQKATVSVYVDAKTEKDLDAFREFLLSRDREAKYELVGPVKEFLQFIGPSRSDIWGRAMIEPEKVLGSDWFRRYAPDVYKSLVRDGFYPGPNEKHGDGWRMELAMTLLPGRSTKEGLALLDKWIAERGLKRTLHFITPESVATPQEGRAWESLKTVLSLDPEHADVGVYVLSISYTNSAYLRARGFRAYGISVFNVSINDASKIHHPNERIILPYFVEGVERMKRILLEFATAP
jgi:acetylornithine deacetylase/succinyl-diaminopimelate desuccinylase-like protein